MNKKTTIIIPLLVAVSIVAGILIGNLLNQNSRIIQSPVMGYSQPNKLATILQIIENGYVDSVDASNIVEETIPEVLKNLDPHTAYIPARNMQEVHEEMSGNFSGIGVQFSIQDDTVRVIEVIPNGPSSKVGLQPGDRIVTVNDSLIAGVDVKNNTVLKLLRGERNSKVEVGIIRKGNDEQLEYEITRDNIPLVSVDVSYMIDDETGFIKVSRFSEQTYNEFMQGMEKIHSQGARKVIVDLRQNPGGSLSSVLQLMDEFLEKGEDILYTEGKNQPRKTYKASGKNTWKDKEVYVLIDEFSASASEIFAGALQDNDRGLVIGRRSFGKGLVQEQIPLMDGSALRLTVARFYTPSGRSIQKPYENGSEEYYQDLHERFSHNEQLNADSIHFNDSLIYHTKAGRTVYGGGGIMPDVFVPMDTTGHSAYFEKLFRKGLVYTFAYNYADNNRNSLSEFQTVSELEAYLDRQNVLNEFVAYAEKNDVPRDDEGLKQSEELIHTQLKAYIARNVMGEEGYFPIIMQIDNTLKKAIELSKQNLVVENLLKESR
ncbi:MAG: S41 family peptidase [Mariniphaga sp.]